uniref:Uncharacterized protein n=1 Tax=Lepeophtheirus salmonis TaxID=72036 RepID=A0A0K2V4X1_LEPSM
MKKIVNSITEVGVPLIKPSINVVKFYFLLCLNMLVHIRMHIHLRMQTKIIKENRIASSTFGRRRMCMQN